MITTQLFIVSSQLRSLERQRHAATLASPMAVTPPPIYKSGSCRMSRRHCHSARRESRPSKLRPLEPRLPERSHTDIYSLAHAIGMLPRAYHHCHSTRRETRPSNCALSNDKRPAGCTILSHDAFTFSYI